MISKAETFLSYLDMNEVRIIESKLVKKCNSRERLYLDPSNLDPS